LRPERGPQQRDLFGTFLPLHFLFAIIPSPSLRHQRTRPPLIVDLPAELATQSQSCRKSRPASPRHDVENGRIPNTINGQDKITTIGWQDIEHPP
jgi:hypothetical protein